MSAPKAFVVGWPIAHSRSPLIHRFWLARYGIDGDYLAEAVPPQSIEAFFGNLGERGYVGGNVTLPHKEAAFRAAASATAVAAKLKAANTLWLKDGRIHADNTDVYGFATNLDEEAREWRRGSTALVLGAGGASRAVLAALVDAGYSHVALLNRTAGRAEALAREFGPMIRAGGLDNLAEAITAADLVVNATSAELDGNAGLLVPWQAAKKPAIATDLVYVPLLTPFLRGAMSAGLKVVDGLGMLLHQAAPGFERWFGVRPAVDAELRAHIVADLER